MPQSYLDINGDKDFKALNELCYFISLKDIGKCIDSVALIDYVKELDNSHENALEVRKMKNHEAREMRRIAAEEEKNKGMDMEKLESKEKRKVAEKKKRGKLRRNVLREAEK